MKKLLILLAVLGLATPALAITDPAPNGVGVYFDLTGDSNCNNNATPYTPLNAYVLATNPTQSCGISGWEGFLFVNPTSFPAGITFDIGTEALNVFTAPSFQVGYAVSRVGNPIKLLTVTTFYLGGPIFFGLGPGFPSSFNTGDPLNGYAPGYADGCNPGLLIPFKTSSNTTPWTLPYLTPQSGMPLGHAFVVATVNAGPCVTATEKSTWGGVKDLYK